MVAIPDWRMKELVADGEFSITPFVKENFETASIDVGPRQGGYGVATAVHNKASPSYLSTYVDNRGRFSDETVLERGQSYVFRGPSIEVPDDFEVYIDQKSTAGRLGLQTDVMTEEIPGADEQINHIPAGYTGELYLRVTPRAFPVQIEPGDDLVQMRLTEKGTGFLEPEELSRIYGHLFDYRDADGGQIPEEDIWTRGGTRITANTDFAFQQKRVEQPIVWNEREHAEISDYWKVVLNGGDKLAVPPHTLILLSNNEAVKTGPDLCWKMAEKTEGLGQHAETHQAGFGDCGFFGNITAELYNHGEELLLIGDGGYLSELQWEAMSDTPASVYGEESDSNYQAQFGLPLPPKQFRSYSEDETILGMVERGDIDVETRDVQDVEAHLDQVRAWLDGEIF